MQKMKLMAGILVFACVSVQGMDQRFVNPGQGFNQFDGGRRQPTALEIEQGFSAAPEQNSNAWQAPRAWPIITNVYAAGQENLQKTELSMMFTPKSDTYYGNQMRLSKIKDTVYSPVRFCDFEFPQTFQLSESRQGVKYVNVTPIIRTLPENVQYFEGSVQKAIPGIAYLNNFLYYCGKGDYDNARGMLSCLKGQKAAVFGYAVKPMLTEEAVKNVLEAKISWADGFVGSLSGFMNAAEKAAKSLGKQLQEEEALKKAIEVKNQAAYQAATFLGKFNMAFKNRVNAWGGMMIGAAVIYGYLWFYSKLK